MDDKKAIDTSVIENTESTELEVSIATKIRTALFFVAWVNQMFAFAGAPTLDLDSGEVYGVVSAIVTFGVSVCAWWKNNSFTAPALLGDAALDAAKHAKL